MAITSDQLSAARKAGKSMGPHIVSACYKRTTGKLAVEYDNGVSITVPITLLQEFSVLENPPSNADLADIEVWGGGYDLHFPRIDTFISGSALLKGILGTKAWMRELARGMGASTSPAKAAAARANGLKGGRPRKQPTAA